MLLPTSGEDEADEADALDEAETDEVKGEFKPKMFREFMLLAMLARAR